MLTREEILAKATGGEVVNLPSGGQVKVRGLTRDEALELQEREGTAARDNYCIATGMVEPRLSEEEVAELAKQAPAGDMVEISRAVSRLSGMSEGAGKSGPTAPRRRR